MNKKLKYLILFAIVAIIIAVGVTLYMFNKPHRNIANEKADYTISAAAMVAEYIDDETSSDTKYLDKVISIEGELIDKEVKESGSVVLLFIDNYEGLCATFDSSYVSNNPDLINSILPGNSIKVKGKCDGFLMLQGVMLNKCVLIED